MINDLYIENYKSFKEGNFSFSNLTFFVGANSCGKSSITNLLLLLSQSLDSSFDFDTILRLNGKHIGFGDDLNIIKDHNVDNKVTISWSIEDSKEGHYAWSTQDIIDEFYHTFLYNDSVIRRLYGNNKKSDYTTKSSALRADAESQYYRNVEDIHSSNLLSILKRQQVLISKINKNDDEASKSIKTLLRKYSSARLKDLLQFIETRDHLKMIPSSLKLILRYNSNINEVEVEEHSISNKSGDKIISFIFNPTGRVDVKSDIIDDELLKRSRSDIVKGIKKNSILLSNFSSSFTDVKNNDNPFASYCLSYVNQATHVLCQQLIDDKIYHVSPLRALPQRYYLLEKSAHHKTINSYNGTEVTEVLKNNPQILDSVNDFFSEFNISILPVKVRDVIHKITIKQDGISVDLTDVGFGISQVLPILVQLFLCEEESTIIIEQPEIHLHPNMQAILATLLARVSIKHKKKLIIETHSEAMIRRIQRLYLDPKFELGNDNVRVYQFKRNDDGSSEALCDMLGPLGDIKWLKGFKDVEIEDTIEIQKLRSLKVARGNNIE